MKRFSPCVSATNGTPFLKSAATFKSAGNCISDCTARLSWRVKGVRIEISACEMAPDKLVGFLFHLPARDGVAMLARLHAARQGFLSQLRLPLPAPGTRRSNGAKEVGPSGSFLRTVPCLTAVPQLFPCNGWRPIHVQEPSVPPGRPMGWVGIWPGFACCPTHFLCSGRQTCCL